MILEDCHHFVFVKVGHPVEQCVKISGRVSVECLANTIDGNMVVDKLYLVFVCFKRFDHELFLITRDKLNEYP